MHLTDCAFLFFTGVSLRIWDPEIECDLPCHEEIFDAAHPFTHPDFSFRRPLTTQQAFSALFATDQPQTGPHTALTMLDSFVLIHSKPRMLTQSLTARSLTNEWNLTPVIYRFANAVLSVQLTQSRFADEDRYPSNTIISDIRTALSLWFKEWTWLHEMAVSKDEWDGLGFYKNGDQYAYATLLLLSSKARPHLRWLLGPNTDRLSRLQEINK